MRIGIDLGGSKIEGVVLGPAGEVIARERIPAPHGDYAATLSAIAGLIAALEAKVGGEASIGIGMPGALSRATGLVKNSNSTWLIDHPFHTDLEQVLKRPIRLANDADCFALSEAHDGAGVGAATIFGVILGTGVGGGLVVDRKLLLGVNAIAGEWGHNQLPWIQEGEHPGNQCYCGKRGCIETFLSGPAFEADYARVAGQMLSAADIAKAAQAGKPEARDALNRYCNRLARALSSVINILDPEVIVLGGGISNIDMLYNEVPAYLPAYVFSDRVDTRLLRNHHGDASGVRGAAWLWPEYPETQP